jgi:hypothetical protein
MFKKKSKYSNTKTNGYDSKKESKRAGVLKMLNKGGAISELQEQVPFVLAPAQYVTNTKGKQVCARRELKYIADFVYIQNGLKIVEDCKGFKTKEYIKKKNLMKRIFDIEIKET